MRIAGGLALAVLAAACSGGGDAPPPSTAPSATAATAAGFRAEISMQELMAHVIDYNADGVWLNQGWVQSAAGTEELFPSTPEGWLATENAALTLAESANLLLMPGRAPEDEPAWIDFAHRMHEASMAAARAAETAAADPTLENKQAFFDRGGDIYVVCRDCHQRYVIGETP